jgi:hypothetical protein
MSEQQVEQLNIEKFNPTIAEIQRIVVDGKKLTITDFADKLQVKAVRDQRLQLKEIRVNITKQGKAFRQKALDFQKAVIGKEKEIIAFVEPEELRLAGLEEQADQYAEREKRKELLPKRKDRLAAFNDGVEIPDDEILDMDSTLFEGYCNKRLADKNEKDRLILEEQQRKIKEEEARVAREKELREVEDRARADERKRTEEAEANLRVERERAEKESKERAERTEREAKERADKIEREAKEKVEREERERKEKAEVEVKEKARREENERINAAHEKEKLAKDKKYQEFLASHGWTEKMASEFYVEVKGNIYSLYKKVGEITL